MKLLLDSCMWSGCRAELETAGHEVTLAADWPQDPGDEEILARARQEQRVLVTLDRDFGELAVSKQAPHAGIIRLVKIPFRDHARVILKILATHATALQSGALVTASPAHLRIRLPAE